MKSAAVALLVLVFASLGVSAHAAPSDARCRGALGRSPTAVHGANCSNSVSPQGEQGHDGGLF